MHCIHCGSYIDEDAVFCESCGRQVDEADTPPVTPVQPAAPIKKRGISKLIVAECILLAALCVGCFSYIRHLNNPETVLKGYWDAVVAQDWGTAYGYLDIPDEGLLGEERFRQMALNMDLDKVKNYRIVKADEDEKSDALYSGMKSYRIEYVRAGSNDTYTTGALLAKSNKKKYLILDEWKVMPEGLIQEDIRIEAPAFATVSINGIALQEPEAEHQEEAEVSIYSIPYLFTGEYILECASEVFAPYSRTVDIDSGNRTVLLDKGYLPEETLQEFTEQAVEYAEQINRDMLDGRVETSAAPAQDGLYESFCEHYELSEGAFYKSGVFNYYTSTLMDSGYRDGRGYVQIRLSWDYSIEYVQQERFRRSQGAYSEKKMQGTEYMDFYFTRSDDLWGLEEVKLTAYK